MKLCAIVLDYRGALKTEACLTSLCGQGIDTVLLVDNSDSDDASNELASVVHRLHTSALDYRLHVLKPDTNLGFARGVNFAIGHPASQHCNAILLLNNDATMAPDAVRRMMPTLDSAADLVVPAITGDCGEPRPQLHYQRFFGLLTECQLPGSYPYPSGCCMIFKRSLAPSGKLFDESFFMYGEDTFLGWTLFREKKRALQVSEAKVRHSGQGTEQPSTLFYEYHIARAHLLLATKTVRAPIEIPVLVCTKIIGLFLRSLRRTAKYRSLLPVRALLLAWRRLDIRKA